MLERARDIPEIYDGEHAYTIKEIVKKDREKNGPRALSRKTWREIAQDKVDAGEWVQVNVWNHNPGGPRVLKAYIEKDEYEKWVSNDDRHRAA
jgi:hypothetical protein